MGRLLALRLCQGRAEGQSLRAPLCSLVPRSPLSKLQVGAAAAGGLLLWLGCLLHWVLGQWCCYVSPYIPMGPQRQVEERERECQRQIRGWEQGGAEEVGSIFSFSG